jgi:hypothetical protein
MRAVGSTSKVGDNPPSPPKNVQSDSLSPHRRASDLRLLHNLIDRSERPKSPSPQDIIEDDPEWQQGCHTFDIDSLGERIDGSRGQLHY